MKKVIIVILELTLALALAGAGWAGNTPASGQAQAVCPVMGGKINPKVNADYQGQRVYFCCPGCVGMFQQAPEKYLKKLEAQGITPERVAGRN